MPYLDNVTQSLRNRYMPIILGILFIISAVLSLSWRMYGDGPIFWYIAFLVDQYHYIPYVHFIDSNTPSVFLTYTGFGYILGYSELSFRFGDLCCLCGLLLVTYFMLRAFNKQVAIYSALLWGLVYIGLGPYIAFQREAILLVPLALTVWFTASDNYTKSRVIILGVAFGYSISMRPMAVVFVVPIAVYMLFTMKKTMSGKNTCIILLLFALSVLIPFILTFIYLYVNNAHVQFYKMATEFWPLMSKTHSGSIRSTGIGLIIGHLKKVANFQDFYPWVLLSALGTYIALFDSSFTKQQKYKIVLIIAFLISSLIYPMLYGRYLPYHFLPAFYFSIVLAAFVVSPLQPENNRKMLFPILCLIAILFASFTGGIKSNISMSIMHTLRPQWSWTHQGREMYNQIDETTKMLDRHVSNNKSVASIGIPHLALLNARVKLGSPLINHTYLWNPQHEYVRVMRDDMVYRMKSNPPDYMLLGRTIPNFNEYYEILEREYVKIDSIGHSISLLKRRD